MKRKLVVEDPGDPRQRMRIALVNNLALNVCALESGRKISGKQLARFFNSNHGRYYNKRETDKADVERGCAKHILYTGGVTDQKDEGNFKNKGQSQIFVLQAAYKQTL